MVSLTQVAPAAYFDTASLSFDSRSTALAFKMRRDARDRNSIDATDQRFVHHVLFGQKAVKLLSMHVADRIRR